MWTSREKSPLFRIPRPIGSFLPTCTLIIVSLVSNNFNSTSAAGLSLRHQLLHRSGGNFSAWAQPAELGICIEKILGQEGHPVHAVFLGRPPDDAASLVEQFGSSEFIASGELLPQISLSTRKAVDLVIIARNLSVVVNTFGLPPNATLSMRRKQKTLAKQISFIHHVLVVTLEHGENESVVERELLKLQGSTSARRLVYSVEDAGAEKMCWVKYTCLFCCEAKTCVREDSAQLLAPASKSFKIMRHDLDNWDLSGAELRTAYVQFYKNWFVTSKTKDGKFLYDGSDYRLVETLRKHLNFTYKLMYEIEGGLQPGTVDRNGSWNGIVGAFQRKEIDFMATSVAISYDRAEHIDFAMPYEFSGFHLLQGRPRRKSTVFTAIFAPFQAVVWVLILAAVVLMAVAIYVLETVGHGKKVSVSRTILILTCVLVSQDPDLRLSKRKHANVLVASWVWFATFITMCYTALYYGFMVAPLYEKPVESLTELFDSNQRWFAYVTTVMMTYAKYKPLGDKAIYRTWEQRPGDFETIKNNPGVYSTMLDKSALNNKGLALKETFNDFASGKFYISRYPAAEYWKAMGVLPGSPLLEKLSPVYLALFEGGICSQNSKTVEMEQQLGSVSFDQMRYNQAANEKNRNAESLNLLDNLLAAFVILAAGWVLGFFGLILEAFNSRILKVSWLF